MIWASAMVRRVSPDGKMYKPIATVWQTVLTLPPIEAGTTS
jgi:hypothetical protein